ncbi:hypothetical protein MFLAVUS_009970 [Mucor flavus]|uniref:GTP-binding protein n=1 Tax=Mucor flavus TaxID=439312 RepID=A0ABP9ZBI2_9FUNG
MNEHYLYAPFETENGPTLTNQIMVGSPVDKPRILLMGLPSRSFIDFQIWDFPGQVNFFDNSAYDAKEIFDTVGSLVFVIDAQDDYSDSLHRLQYTIVKAYQVNPNMTFEILIHKVDGLSDDYKDAKRNTCVDACFLDVKIDIIRKMQEYLKDIDQEENISLLYHLTSIYDNSIYEAFSKIIQKLIRELPTLENLLNILRTNSGLEKAYLFDTLTKIYIATDSTPVEMDSYELCSDMIDVVLDIECIYGPQSGCGPYTKDGYDEATLDELELSGHFEGTNATSNTFNTDIEASSIIKLNNGDVLYMKEINSLLALICMIRGDNFKKHGLIDYNFRCFTSAVTELFKFSQKNE